LNLSVFILAAGLGERLSPITNHIPKPLIPILGKPVLQSVLERVITLPLNNIGINLHHKKEDIEAWINHSPFRHIIELFPEDPVLGTGGALKNAEGFLKDSIFLVHNSDIISDIDLQELVDFHLSSHNLATFAVHDYPEFNKLAVDEKGFFKGFNSSSEKLKNVAFTGISVYDPEFLKFLPTGVSSVVDAWSKAIRSGEKIGTFDVTGCYWSDIGTPASYAKAVINELRKNGETVYVHPSVRDCNSFEMDGYVAIENESILDQGISLRNCIVLPGTEIEKMGHDDKTPQCFLTLFWGTGRDPYKGQLYENCILGPGFKIDLSESDLFDSAEGNSFLIGTGGSDRKYSRVKLDKHSAVLMQSPDGDPDFQRHIEYTQFFRGHSIPVPELIDIASDNKTALFEDFGDLSLYSWLKCPRDRGMIEKMYKKVIDILILIHTEVTEHISECPLLRKRIFDYEHLRWETGYFVERFVEGVSKIKTDNLPELNEEFHRLALKVDSFPKTIVHRDFQSQNIMIAKGGIPRIIDYQGARIGPPAYDLVSILWDPYYRLEDSLREKLFDYYINKITNPPQSPFAKVGLRGIIGKEGQKEISEKEFRDTLLPCRLQRHMQALGAYSFLSSVKGKKYFLNHIPEGLRLLKEDVALTKDTYPELYNLVISIS
jgi:NDP-sugar pyrophosphorylase family protein/aminoglycoside/choline kinase family phosphotransferase